MKRNLKRIFTVGFLAVFLWSAVFCCCKMNVAQNNPCHKIIQVKTVTCGLHGNSATGSCSCKAGFLAENYKPKIKFSLEKNDVSLVALVTAINPLVYHQFVRYESPPSLEVSDSPLYLLNRVLRL